MPFIQFQFRRGTSSQWNTTNPLLADGEIGIETDTNKFKLGNGVNNWSNLAYGGVQGTQGIQGVQGPQGTQGVQGPQGTQGVQGIGFIWRGAWSSVTTYGINHAVFYNGTSYVSLTAANVNKIPPSFTSDWGVIASQGVQGPQGTQGLQGLQGVQGTQGLQGLQGTQGLQGLNGLFAGQGVQGLQGIQGTVGVNSRTVSYFNAASNQTTFNVVGGYLSNRVDVFKNGVKLQRVSDYTDTSGTDIVLVAPATDNDLIEIITYTAIPQMSDVYTQAQSDARYVNNQKLFAVNWIFGA